MKTLELLDKYQKLIGSLLKIKPNEISFYVDGGLVGEIYEPEKKEFYGRDWTLGQFVVKHNDKSLASFKLYQMPHCCAIAVSCNAIVDEWARGRRVGTTLNMLRQEICRGLGYSLLMCTDIEQNDHQRKLLKTNGWKDIYNVVNKRTQNRVYVSVINL